MTAHRMLHGTDFYSGGMFEREKRHQAIIQKNCASVEITAKDLAETIDYDGDVSSHRAAALVRRLIDQAHKKAVAQTLGIPVPPGT